MATQEEFDKAAEDVKNLKSTPSDNDLLELYGLYKQATVGDCNTAKPGFLDFKGKAKWEAWNGRKGMSNSDALNAYVQKVKSLIETVGLKA
ncbi:acyl-CoA-binding domain-containing protein 7 [Stomoxys calcitrans]|uniref:ACB domain-containing protein n=1 Tax=Stomoxys calcitrans TaxID=35570 RepID=A0A1I8QE19_STOCA|nr:acyl-CoA-binding domain-containing protein 7 [Stomoxys calcitrans]XP_013119065.1 acyl-CoA-binding domain-containing protein 7 [Stomoxys calcitrans]